jgi:hypothetical protein
MERARQFTYTLQQKYLPCYVIVGHKLFSSTLDDFFSSCNLQGITNLHFPFADIASKLGHDDVSKLTPIDIALEVLKFCPFYGHQLCATTNFLFSFQMKRSLYQLPEHNIFVTLQSLHKIESFVTEDTVNDSQKESQAQWIQTL